MIMEEDKGKWEEILHSKIYDFQVETNPEDWEVLSVKLSGGKTVRLISYRKIYFTVAAAAAAIALLITGGVYLFSNKEYTQVALDVLEIVQKNEEVVEKPVENIVENVVENVVEKPVSSLLALSSTPEKKTIETGLVTQEASIITPETPAEQISQTLSFKKEILQTQSSTFDNRPGQDDDIIHLDEIIPDEIKFDTPFLAVTTPPAKRRRWGYGVGAGSISAGSTSGIPTLSPTSRLLRPDEYLHGGDLITTRSSLQNATLLDPLDGIELPSEDAAGKTKHKMPVSAGLGISYYLSDSWALQSGAVYTLLRSKGDLFDEAGNPANWKQNLHFIGVPLSVSYSITEWKRINFYVSAGGMGEWNVAGQIKRSAQVEGLNIINSEKLRMTNPLWSVNTKAGASYPLWKFFNLYAEAGASYYFDNKSSIETIRSEKPFNVSLQAGIRLGF